jgi:hypothetical protein
VLTDVEISNRVMLLGEYKGEKMECVFCEREATKTLRAEKEVPMCLMHWNLIRLVTETQYKKGD